MMPRTRPHPVRRLGLAAASLGALVAALPAAGAPPTSHYWYDGDVRRPLYVDDTQVADFSEGRDPKSPVLRSAIAAKAAGASSPAPGAQSPVFKDAAHAGARSRALPGGVVVRLKQPLPEGQAREFLRQRGLEPLRPIGEHSGMWLVQSEPGVKSLDLANQLHESGEFAGASPNWWQARTLK
jgi:hypothetical protein